MTELGTIVDAHTVRFERLLPGPVERVWEFITEPGHLAAWLADASVEARAGGQVRLRFDVSEAPEPDDAAGVILGTITRWEPPRLVAYTWMAPADEAASVEGMPQPEVTFELSEQGTRVRLVLTHRALPTSAMPKFCAGWHTHLAALASRLAGAPPAPFLPAFRSMLPEYERRAIPAHRARTATGAP
ncbi:MAG TPA: SRPBCC family protein [Gemmatimonadaceae bacterium]|nr:SRPBCC family protein [Gemmatimonadaceae bacterium]